MKRIFIFILIFSAVFVCACRKAPETVTDIMTDTDIKPVEHVGEVPEEFKNIVKDNLFMQAAAYEDCLLRSTVFIEGDIETSKFEKLDFYGNVLSSFDYTHDEIYGASPVLTEDGGFIITSPFYDRLYDDLTYASDNGVVSYVIKCDKNGAEQWRAEFEDYQDNAFDYMIEKDGRYYFFGSNQVPETKIKGTHSYTDIYITVLDGNGEKIFFKSIGGSDYDGVDYAEKTENGFRLYAYTQSSDGDFEKIGESGKRKELTIELNDNLDIVKTEIRDGFFEYKRSLGYLNGTEIFNTDALFENFDAGSPTAVVDYGDIYIVVSLNATGIRETPPEVSSIWYHFETVYSGYDKNGVLVFRDAVQLT